MILVPAPASVAADRFTLTLSDPAHGRVAVAATAGTDSVLPVAGELLAALGKGVPREGFHAKDRERARIWLRAHDVTGIIIQHADLYSDRLLVEVDQLANAVGAALWAVVDRGLPPTTMDRLRALSERVTDWPTFITSWKRPSPPSGAALHLGVCDTRPAATLAALEIAGPGLRIDNAFVVAFQTVVDWGRDRHPQREVVEESLRALIDRFEDPRCQLSAARAARTALAEYGWEVALMADAIPSPLTISAERAAASLRRYRDPRVTAAGALWASDLGIGEIRSATLPSGGRCRVEVHGAPVDVTAELDPYVRAHVLARINDGARPGDWLFVGERGQQSARALESMLLVWLQSLDDYATLEGLRARRPEHGRWLAARGVGVRWIPRLEREQPAVARRRHADLLPQMESALRRGLDAKECRCSQPHRPGAHALPAWPPMRNHAPPSAHHPWAFRSLGHPRS